MSRIKKYVRIGTRVSWNGYHGVVVSHDDAWNNKVRWMEFSAWYITEQLRRLDGGEFKSDDLTTLKGDDRRTTMELENERLRNALLAIKTMDVYTREGEEPAHEVMRKIAAEALT